MKKSVADTDQGITRGELLKAAAVATPAFLLARHGVASAARTRPRTQSVPGASGIAGMNVLLFLTDQQRAVQHFPPGWTKRNMPGMTRLLKHGMLVRQRVHERVHVLAGPLDPHVRVFPGPARRQVHARDGYADAPVSPGRARPRASRTRPPSPRAAGYTPVYKGKFHCNKPANGSTWVPSDVNQYGFTRWDPPDAGANQSIPEEGGGVYDNDGRFMNSTGHAGGGHRGHRSVPEHHGRPEPAVLHGRLAGQPARRAAATRRPTSAAAMTRHMAGRRDRAAGDRATRTCRPSRPSRPSSCGCSTPPGRFPRRR